MSSQRYTIFLIHTSERKCYYDEIKTFHTRYMFFSTYHKKICTYRKKILPLRVIYNGLLCIFPAGEFKNQ